MTVNLRRGELSFVEKMNISMTHNRFSNSSRFEQNSFPSIRLRGLPFHVTEDDIRLFLVSPFPDTIPSCQSIGLTDVAGRRDSGYLNGKARWALHRGSFRRVRFPIARGCCPDEKQELHGSQIHRSLQSKETGKLQFPTPFTGLYCRITIELLWPK